LPFKTTLTIDISGEICITIFSFQANPLRPFEFLQPQQKWM